MNSQVPASLEQTINTLLISTHALAHLTDRLAFDFSFTSPPVVSNAQLSLYLNSTLIDGQTYQLPNTPADDLEIDSSSQGQVQMALSHYAADSVLVAVFNSGALARNVSSNEQLNITTSLLQGLLPGLVRRYGPDQNVTVGFKATEAPRAIFEKDIVGIVFTVELAFVVGNETAIVIRLEDLDVKVGLQLSGALLKVQISEVRDCNASASDS